MGKIKSYLHSWLEEYGYDLGYDMSNAPEFEDMDWVVNDEIDAHEYWTNKSKWEKQAKGEEK